MKHGSLVSLLLLLLCLATAGWAAEEEIDPIAQSFQQYRKEFAALPPARNCSDKDLQGAWQLNSILDKPKGPAAQSLTQSPHQYIGFGEYNQTAQIEGKEAYTPKDIMAQVGTVLTQYILTGQSVLYLYKNGTFDTGFLCQIVEKPDKQFKAGQMLLMRLDNDVKNHSVKIYESMLKPSEALEEK